MHVNSARLAQRLAVISQSCYISLIGNIISLKIPNQL
jgi:hypothetical protein